MVFGCSSIFEIEIEKATQNDVVELLLSIMLGTYLVKGGLGVSITSLLFLFLFLPLSLAIYYIANDKVKEYVLLAISLLFYAIGSVEYIVLFIIAIVFTVLVGRVMNYLDQKPIRLVLLIVGILGNLSILFYYKYFNFVLTTWGQITSQEIQVDEILLPLGISFYSFKAISYLVDIYNKRVQLNDNPMHDALYLSFFAQIQSGPITRYGNMQQI